MRSRAELLAEIRAGTKPEYVLFWGHRPRKDSTIGKSCLSQWWMSEFTVDGHTYASAEHWMMAGKARLFKDEESLARVLASTSAPEAKKLGRQVQGFESEAWSAAAFTLVVEGNVHKFGQNEALKSFLLGTGDRVLVEASPQDRIWGIGLAEQHQDACVPSKWHGENLLGFALMEARARLR